VKKRIDILTQKLKSELGLFLSISFCVFLFILFFQPFPPKDFTFNNYLIFVVGLGAIVFFSIVIVRTILPGIIGEAEDDDNKQKVLPTYFKGFMIFIISALAFEFYLAYVGSVKINFFISFKVVLVCLSTPLILEVHDSLKSLRQQNEMLIREKKLIQKQIEKFQEEYLNKSVEFVSENTNDNFSLLIAEIAFVRSADNYVEIVFTEGTVFRKKLIRNTLKNVEQQIGQYTNFLRCHRTCIVNVHFIEKLIREKENYWLSVKGFNEQLPVSRQHLLKLKESI
jgi:DNA-binding LytR/AlgR family response regulator